MADQVPQPAPACGLRAVHRRADAGRAEFEQRLGGVAVVARDESDGGDGGELAHQTRDRRKLVVAALEGIRHPSAAPERHRAARDYIASELRTLGLRVDLAPFSFRGRTYHNVVGSVPGSDARRPRLLVGAHFDSTAHTPGADDNASGVAALLECARLIASRTPQAGVEFVGFDLEELQTVTGRYRVGSHALAREKRARRETLAGALILEMVGYRDARPGTQIVPPFLGIDVPRTGDFLAAGGAPPAGREPGARRGGRPLVPPVRLPGAAGPGVHLSRARDAREAAQAGERRRARGRPRHGDHDVSIRDGGGAGGGCRPRAVRRGGPGGAQPSRSRRYTVRSAALKHPNRTSSTDVGFPSPPPTVAMASSAARAMGNPYAPLLFEGEA